MARERIDEFVEREQIETGARSAVSQLVPGELAREHHRGGCRHLRPVAVRGDQSPAQAQRHAVGVDAAQVDLHHADIAAAREPALAQREQGRRVAREIAHDADTHGPRRQPQSEMHAAQFKSGAEVARAQVGMACRQHRQVRHFAAREPARADPGDMQPAQRLPAMRARQSAVAQDRIRFSGVAEDRARRRQTTWRAIAGADRAFETVEAAEPPAQRGDDGAAEAGHAARAADGPSAGSVCNSVERVESGDEVAPVGEVDVVRTERERSACDAVVALLERPGRVDHKMRGNFAQAVREVGRVDVDADGRDGRAGAACVQPVAQCLCLSGIAAGDDEVKAVVPREGAADAFAEQAVAAEDEDPEGTRSRGLHEWRFHRAGRREREHGSAAVA